MMSSELSHRLLDFLEVSVPSYDAAKVLLHHVANRGRSIEPGELVMESDMKGMTLAAVREHAAHFVRRRLLIQEGERFRYSPDSAHDERMVAELIESYNERPVSLIVAISRIETAHGAQRAHGSQLKASGSGLRAQGSGSGKSTP